jgi:orotidine-5'-phosphate decarboxylase
MTSDQNVPVLVSNAFSARLMLGIDPDANSVDLLLKNIERHQQILRLPSTLEQVSWLKPNISFFLRHGSKGIALLEALVDGWKNQGYKTLLDAKFSEINNSLQGNLDFCFKTLGAHAVTLNPFLGEKSIELALNSCEESAGPEGVVYVLCQTSQQSTENLRYLQERPHTILSTLQNIQKNHRAQLGAVVGAAHLKTGDFLEQINSFKGPFLCPGLGAQGVLGSELESQPVPNPCHFPVSRGVFGGGELNVTEMQTNLRNFLDTISSIETSWNSTKKEKSK